MESPARQPPASVPGAPGRLRARVHRRALRIAGIYAAFATAWIALSDQIVQLLAREPARLVLLSTAKGILFVAATAAMLYALVRADLDELDRANARLRSVLAGMPDPVFVAAEGRITDVNDAAVALLGLSDRAEALVPLAQLRERLRLRGADGTAADPLAEALAGRTVRMEVQLTRPDGRPVHAAVSASPISDPTSRRAVAVLRDITEVRRLERLRDDFLATAAHELKTPVAAIRGWVQMLGRWSPEGRDAREKAAFDVLQRQSERIARLVEELLEVSRTQMGRVDLRRRAFDLCDLAQEAVGRQRTLAPRRRVVLLGVPVPVQADRDRIDQVLANLLDNAVRFSPDDAPIEVRVWREDALAHVTVTDRGPGIPAERRRGLFEPFYRAHEGTARAVSEGLGMGLFISHQILRRHGGQLWLEGGDGPGTTFHFVLPAEPAVAEAHAPTDGDGVETDDDGDAGGDGRVLGPPREPTRPGTGNGHPDGAGRRG